MVTASTYTGMRGFHEWDEYPKQIQVVVAPGQDSQGYTELLSLPQSLDDYRKLWKALVELEEKDEAAWVRTMQIFCAGDLFFGMNFVATAGREARAYDDSKPFFFDEWHLRFAREVQFFGEGKVIVASRGWGKSSWITWWQNITAGLADPNSTSCIFSTTKELGQKHLLKIGQELDNNDLLRRIWPDRVWKKNRPTGTPWSKGDGYQLPRTTNRTELTFECQALIARLPVGMHYDRHYVDDAEEETSVANAENMQKVSDRFTSAQNLVSNRSQHWFVGTYYHPNGLCRELEVERGYDVLCFPCEDLSIRPENPEEAGPMGGLVRGLHRDQLWKKWETMGCAGKPREKKNYAMQVCMDPLAGETTRLSRNWVRWFKGDPREYAERNECCFIICQDPSPGNDNPTFTWVWMLDWRRRLIWVDGWRNVVKPRARNKKSFETYCNWAHIGLGVEQFRVENFGQAEYVDQLEDYFDDKRMDVLLVPCHDTSRRTGAGSFEGRDGGKREKEFMRWEPALRNGQVLFPADGIWTEDDEGATYNLVDYFLDHELDQFPKPKYDDGLDAGALIWYPEKQIGAMPWPARPEKTRDIQSGRFLNRGRSSRSASAGSIDLGIL